MTERRFITLWHDGPIQRGFIGYNRRLEDPNGETPSGTSLDTYLHDSNILASAEELEVMRRFDEGEISREEAETLLDTLALNQDS